MRVLFVDHRFHQKTRSSDFFLELLRQNFEVVDVEYVDVERQDEIRALSEPRLHDLVVIWQLDFLGPAFLAAGYATVIVPMYDGSANLPYEHWIAMNGASFLCFSRTVHERVTAAGCRSYLVKYFLPPCQESLLPKFVELRGCFWMRRPQEMLTPKLIERLLGPQLTALHVHNAPDDGRPRLLSDPTYRVSAFPVTESRWSGKSNPYLSALKSANVVFAPRMSEGIGMTILEGLAMGLLVIANDDAVHNEYIANWINGILFHPHTSESFDLPVQTARELAYCGWYGGGVGYSEWMDSRGKVIEFIKETTPAFDGALIADHQFTAALWDAFLLGVEAYTHFLRENVVTQDCIWVDKSKITRPLRSLLDKSAGDLPLLDEDGLFFGTSSKSVVRKYGFADFDAFSARLSSNSAGFSATYHVHDLQVSKLQLAIACQVGVHVDVDWRVLVHVNQKLAPLIMLPRQGGDVLIEVPVPPECSGDLSVMLSFLQLGSARTPADFPDIRFNSVTLRANQE